MKIASQKTPVEKLKFYCKKNLQKKVQKNLTNKNFFLYLNCQTRLHTQNFYLVILKHKYLQYDVCGETCPLVGLLLH